MPRVGVFIPCIPEHLSFLPHALGKLSRGYVPPHRIAVVISGLAGHRGVELPDSIRVRRFDQLVETGPAKQMAYEMLHDCDVVCYQDADDAPALNRVGYIQNLFASANVDAFNHSYRTSEWEPGDPEDDYAPAYSGMRAWRRYFPRRKIRDATRHRAFGAVLRFPVHAGAISVRRNVLEKVRWRSFSDLPLFPKYLDKTKGDDWHFCFECLYALKRTHWFSRAVLYRYRVH
jgi:hypothetical protein